MHTSSMMSDLLAVLPGNVGGSGVIMTHILTCDTISSLCQWFKEVGCSRLQNQEFYSVKTKM